MWLSVLHPASGWLLRTAPLICPGITTPKFSSIKQHFITLTDLMGWRFTQGKGDKIWYVSGKLQTTGSDNNSEVLKSSRIFFRYMSGLQAGMIRNLGSSGAVSWSACPVSSVLPLTAWPGSSNAHTLALRGRAPGNRDAALPSPTRPEANGTLGDLLPLCYMHSQG